MKRWQAMHYKWHSLDEHLQASLMHHSDQGCQYTSATYQARLKQSALTVSMSQAGNRYDDAVAERFFGSLKSERTDQEIYHTRTQAKSAVIDYIEGFYNS